MSLRTAADDSISVSRPASSAGSGNPRTGPPLWRMIAKAYLATVAAFLLGTLATLPFMTTRARTFVEESFLIDRFPEDDAALRTWGAAVPGVLRFETTRGTDSLRIRIERRGLRREPGIAEMSGQLRELGYAVRGMEGGASGLLSRPSEVLTDPVALAVMLAGAQVAFIVLGLAGIHRSRQQPTPVAPLFAGNHLRATAIGILAGLFLIGFGLAYGWLLEFVVGSPAPSPWDSADQMSPTGRILFLVFGAIGAPVAEEIFFRGRIFGTFRAAGRPIAGGLVSSVLFAAIHISDPYHIPAICVFGVTLAVLFHRTRSLLAPIAAHAVNNGVAILALTLG